MTNTYEIKDGLNIIDVIKADYYKIDTVFGDNEFYNGTVLIARVPRGYTVIKQGV